MIDRDFFFLSPPPPQCAHLYVLEPHERRRLFADKLLLGQLGEDPAGKDAGVLANVER